MVAYGFIFYGLPVTDADDADADVLDRWPEPYRNWDGVVHAWVRATDPECKERSLSEYEDMFASPTIFDSGRYYLREAESGERVSVVTAFDGGYKDHLDGDVIHPCIGIRESYQAGTYTSPYVFDSQRCMVPDATLAAWRESLRDFCEKTGIPFIEPRWHIMALVDH